ncbi:hypothetical protein GXP67_25545 [Rhodocytophaga rosea]|uniref:Uncharacterized protein n=1 Tax=Rhodocytophaga rosea TaxID=2704465 RepID=A0A6C0GP04_9BACT|nr:hypothetical protein [Rhodocytophaga rosea]QHT69769.1 hypothetical protein GXP67_25545 [Rhodocytophaga rosea]
MYPVYLFRKASKLLMAGAILTLFFAGIYVAGKSLIEAESLVLQKYQMPVAKYIQADWEPCIDSLRELYGKNKQLIKAYELQILLALSHYPELKEIPIHYYQEEAFLPLASRPEPFRMLYSKQNWQYNVIISTKSIEAMEPILVKNLPFEAQVGIIGHELAHTSYYLDKSVWQMILIGLNYIFPDFRADFEKNTDRRTIAHGLGWQLLSYAHYARQVMPYEETSLGSKYYLSPAEIELQINQTY